MSGLDPKGDHVRWIQTWESARTGTFRIGRCGSDPIAEWVGDATLRADRDGSHVRLDFAPGCDEGWARKLREGPAAALVRHLRGGITIHAAAVGLAGSGVLLLGESGSGKSTLAADLCEHADATLLGDDTAALAFSDVSIDVLPTERVNWLSPDAREHRGTPLMPDGRKLPVPVRRVAAEPIPLCAIVKLTFDDASRGCHVSRVRGGLVFTLLSLSQFRFVVDEPEVTLRDFEHIERLGSLVPLYELRRPRDLHVLQATGKLVASLVSAAGKGECDQRPR